MPVTLGIGTLIGIAFAGMCCPSIELWQFSSKDRGISSSTGLRGNGFTVGETGQAASWVFYLFIIITATLPVLSSGGPAYAVGVSHGGGIAAASAQSQ